MSSVITEPELVERSMRLETSIANQNLNEFCESKIAGCRSKDDQEVWQFIKAKFGEAPRRLYLELLGFQPEETWKKVSR